MKSIYFSAYFALTFLTIAGYSAENKSSDSNTQYAEVKITNKGFEPMSVPVKSDAPIILKITRLTDHTCAKSISVPKLNVKRDLPLNETVLVSLGKMEKGQELSFACGMNMMTGVVVAQ